QYAPSCLADSRGPAEDVRCIRRTRPGDDADAYRHDVDKEGEPPICLQHLPCLAHARTPTDVVEHHKRPVGKMRIDCVKVFQRGITVVMPVDEGKFDGRYLC